MQFKPSTFLLIAAIMGSIAVAFGALGAHALEKVLTADQLASWATAVRYQMWHAILLIVLSTSQVFRSALGQRIGQIFLLGVLLFSGSIYLLILLEWKFLGPVTPIGGLLLIAGWILLGVWAWKNKLFSYEK